MLPWGLVAQALSRLVIEAVHDILNLLGCHLVQEHGLWEVLPQQSVAVLVHASVATAVRSCEVVVAVRFSGHMHVAAELFHLLS